MDSQVARPHGHNEQDIHDFGPVGQGDQEEHHEKKSYLEKVKAKAKKIKNTITKHGGYGHQDDDPDMDEGGDEETVEGLDVHGAPSPPPKERTEANTTSTGNYPTKATDPPKIHVPGQEWNKEQPGVNFGGKATVMGNEPHKPQRPPVSFAPRIDDPKETEPTRTKPGQPRVNLERPKDLQEDPNSPKDKHDAYTPSNYQTKVKDPTGTGGQEAGVTPILHSFDKMNIYDEPEAKAKTGQEQNLPTGSHDQFVDSMSTQFSEETMPPKLIPTPETFDATKLQVQPRDNTAEKPSNQSSFSEKTSSAPSPTADKAISPKLGDHESCEGGENAKSSSPVGYGKKIAATVTEKLTPVYGIVAGAGSTVISKIYGTSPTGTGSEQQEGGVKGQDKGVPVKDYVSEKLKPGEEDRALAEVITESLRKPKEERGEVTSDRPMGKVTESEEVSRQLGPKDENSGEKVDSSFVNSPGKGVVDKFKGAFGSLFGKGEEGTQPQAPQQSFGSPHGNEGFTSSARGEAEHNSGVEVERRLQEN